MPFECAALSHTLDNISKEIGHLFAGSSLSPDLRIGTISDFFPGSARDKGIINKASYYRSDDW